jgi:hypothetical protein
MVLQALGRKSRPSGKLCMLTGMRNIAAGEIKSAPMCP